jgi:ribosomal protein S18 acetylase RimI-like enzyme
MPFALRHDEHMKVQLIGPDRADAVTSAADLFDHPPLPEPTQRFLEDPNHLLFIAYDGDTPAGFVSGVLMTHPDKGTEMFLYELSVREDHRRRGVGTALIGALRGVARERGCYGMWVLTDADNAAALAAYAKSGAHDREDTVMLSWRFDRS